MISKSKIENGIKYCCEDISKIEGYNEAITSEKMYVCHHKNGIDKSRDQLKEEGLYYNRPASELIFLSISEHSRLHKKGVNHKGKNNPMYGKHLSEQSKQKISNAIKGKIVGANHPRANQCTINGVTYGCLGDAHKALYPNMLYDTFRYRYKNGKL